MEYIYLVHSTEFESGELIEDVFNSGLKSWYGYSIHSTMEEVDENVINNRKLEEFMKSCVSGQYKTVFLIKIPKDYMGLVLHRDGHIDPPIPFFKDEEDYTVFTPHLIQGCYNKTTGLFVTNPNFSPIFDPTGLKFSDEQLNIFWSLNRFSTIKFAEGRKKLSSNELRKFDIENNTWKTIMKNYGMKYGMIKKEAIYDSSNYSIELERCKGHTYE